MDFSERARMEITQEFLPPKFQNEIVENGNIVIIRSNIKSMKEINEWVKEFGFRTNTKWNTRDSCPSGERFVCRKKFVCRHSAFMKVPPSKNTKGNSKNAECLASVTVKIKLNTSSTRMSDQFAKRGLVGVITVNPSHTHSLLPAANCNLTFENYFNDGIESSSYEENSSSNSESFPTTPTYSSNSESFPTTPTYSSLNNIQAYKRKAERGCRKKELKETLMELFRSGLEKFVASEQALKMAVERLSNISTEKQWEDMLATLGQQCFLKEKG